VTTPRRKQAEPGTRRPDAAALVPDPRPPQQDLRDLSDPYDLPFPDDYRPPRRPEYVIVVDQLRGWQPGQPKSLAELLETGRISIRQPEPDLEAEP